LLSASGHFELMTFIWHASKPKQKHSQPMENELEQMMFMIPGHMETIVANHLTVVVIMGKFVVNFLVIQVF